MAHSLSHGKPLDVGDVGVLDEQLPPWQDGAIDLKAWFGADAAARPLELEIGSGKGTFLVQQAAQAPDVNYLGLEYARSYWQHAADRCRRHGLDNVKLVRAEADFFVRNYVMPCSLRQVHVYFPDPWPKKRHHKRRFICEGNVDQIHRVLKTGGHLKIATDHADYFEHMQTVLRGYGSRFREIEFRPTAGARGGEWVGTNFERKYLKEERCVFTIALEKVAQQEKSGFQRSCE